MYKIYMDEIYCEDIESADLSRKNGATIYNVRKATCTIEGRVCNQKNTYSVVFKKDTRKQDHAFYENGYLWQPIQSIKEIAPENVYDIEVEGSHSFTVQNTIVHNCQDLSNAGKGAGMAKDSGTRSGLLWEVEPILLELHMGGGTTAIAARKLRRKYICFELDEKYFNIATNRIKAEFAQASFLYD